MSEIRPPITAGPIARAFRFLKRTSVNDCGPAGAGEGVTIEESGGVVAAAEAAGGAADVTGSGLRGSSWPMIRFGNEMQPREMVAMMVRRFDVLIGLKGCAVIARWRKRTNPKSRN